MTPTPDIAGYREAQDRLRTLMGQDVTFKVPQAPVWDPDVAIDPETGRPYDPTIDPTSGGGMDEVTIHVAIVFRPVRGRDQANVVDTPAGMESTDNMVLSVAVADIGSISEAASFNVNGRDYRVEDIKPTGVTEIDRYLIFGTAK